MVSGDEGGVGGRDCDGRDAYVFLTSMSIRNFLFRLSMLGLTGKQIKGYNKTAKHARRAADSIIFPTPYTEHPRRCISPHTLLE